jgi:hypothetical protein
MIMQIAPFDMSGKLPGGQPLAGLLKEPEKLDPSFFGLNEGEVGWMDPHHRMLLHLTAHALHRVNFLDKNWQDLQGRKVGVFMSVSNNEWAEVRPEQLSHASERGAAGFRASSLISQCFGLTGPSITVNSACASTMSALETAVQNLLLNKCDVAIVGAAHLLSPKTHEIRERAGLLIKGRSHKLSEGCGVLVLQKVGRARAEGRHIMAVVRGVGTTFVGIQAEEKVARQEELAKQVMEEVGCDADGKNGRVAYVEMSGTGSPDEDEEEGLLLARLYQPPSSSGPSTPNGKAKAARPDSPIVYMGCAKGMRFVCLCSSARRGSVRQRRRRFAPSVPRRQRSAKPSRRPKRQQSARTCNASLPSSHSCSRSASEGMMLWTSYVYNTFLTFLRLSPLGLAPTTAAIPPSPRARYGDPPCSLRRFPQQQTIHNTQQNK